MKTVLLIHGPNLNMLGKRDSHQYGTLTLRELTQKVKIAAKKLGLTVKAFQSNHEGDLIDYLQKEAPHADGIIVNAGALTHYSYALHDALLDTRLPAIEVHLSDVKSREAWRRNSVIAPACLRVISGKKYGGYREAIELLAILLKKKV